MKNKIILFLVLLIPSLCFGGDTYRLQYRIFEEQSEHIVQITSYDDPKGNVKGGLFIIFYTDEKSDYSLNGISMEKLRVYLNEEKLLSHFSEKIQKTKFKRFQFYNEELILKQFLSSGYKVTAFNTEKITFGENKMKGLKKTYFFSK